MFIDAKSVIATEFMTSAFKNNQQDRLNRSFTFSRNLTEIKQQTQFKTINNRKTVLTPTFPFAVLSIMSLTKTNKDHLLKVHGHFDIT